MTSRVVVQGSAMSLLVALIVSATVVSGQSSIDPQSIVGKWQGTWRGRSGNRTTSGSYHLTIDRLEGNKVFLKVFRIADRTQQAQSVTGSRNGNVLKSTTRAHHVL